MKLFEVLENAPLTDCVWKLVLLGDTADITKPGQFVNLKLEGFYLRRPISVCDLDENRLTLIYKVVGDGTKKMTALPKGAQLDLLTGLGNGFDTQVSGDRPLLLGGGVGVPPMYLLAKKLRQEGKAVTAILGFNTACEVFYQKEFEALGVTTLVTTVDGSYGQKGFVTDAMQTVPYSYFYTCGPEPMLRAVYRTSVTQGQFSFERRMGCGFGACMGCSCKTVTGFKRICKEGPVMKKEEILWED